MSSNPPPLPPQPLPTPQLPLSQLESLRFKSNQIIESINGLAFLVGGGVNPERMPAWPEILSKYNIILSQTHSFSNALVNPFPVAGTASGTARSQQQNASGSSSNNAQNIFQKIVVHPNVGMTDQQMDTETGPLLRNQQTIDVLKQENETVRRLSEHMSTRGMLGVLGISNSTTTVPDAVQPPLNGYGGLHALPPRKTEYEDVLTECNEIRDAHDRLVDRAVRAVALLRDKYDWKTRVEVEVEEPEELEWDPRFGIPNRASGGGAMDEDDDSGDDDSDSGDEENMNGRGSSDEEDETNVEELVEKAEDMEGHTPGANDTFGSEVGNEVAESTDMQGIS